MCRWSVTAVGLGLVLAAAEVDGLVGDGSVLRRRCRPVWLAAAGDGDALDRYSPEGLALRSRLFPDAPVPTLAAPASSTGPTRSFAEPEDDEAAADAGAFTAQDTGGMVETPDEEAVDFAKNLLGINNFTIVLGTLALLSVLANVVLGEGWLGSKLNLNPPPPPLVEPTAELRDQAADMRRRGKDLPPDYNPPPVEELLQRLPDADYLKITGKPKPQPGAAGAATEVGLRQ